MNKHRVYLVFATLLLLLMASIPLLGVQAQESGSVFATNTPSAEDAAPTVAATSLPTSAPTLVPTAEAPVAVPEQATVAQVFEPEECRYVEGQSTTDACRAI
ncbi:MAG: hypothetical protein KC615_18540, partial [Anaerolineae bacterium]|nr:hypothetical protein [Anaerolineae bacterium]